MFLIVNVHAHSDGMGSDVKFVSSWIGLYSLIYILVLHPALCGSIRCVYGRCNKPNECYCNAGWQGQTCEEGLLLN